MSIISASTTTTTALQYTADTDGTLVFKTGATPTTALTLAADQSATFAGTVNFATAGFTNLSYTGTLTGGTGVVNIGSGQFYKDASGNIVLGGTTANGKLAIVAASNQRYSDFNTSSAGYGFSSFSYSGTAYGYIAQASATYSGGSNTDFAVVAANNLTLGTGTTERMRIDSSGNVGIGTSSPATKLDVQGSVNGNFYQNLYNSANNASATALYVAKTFGASGVQFGQLQSGALGYVNVLDSTALLFGVGNTERMRIDSSGNVGIGTNNPSGYGSTLAVRGSIKRVVVSSGTDASPSEEAGLLYDDGSSNRTGIYFYNTYQNSGNAWMSFKTLSGNSTIEAMRIIAGGNVGIGISSPSQKLQFATNSATPTRLYAQSDLNFAGLYAGTGNNNRGAIVDLIGHTNTVNADGFRISCQNDVAPQALTFSYAAPTTSYGALSFTERMRLTSGGNLLVNTTSTGNGGIATIASSTLGGAVLQIADNQTFDGTPYGLIQIVRPPTNDAKWMIAFIRNGQQVAGIGFAQSSNTFVVANSGTNSGNGMTLSSGATSWGTQSDIRKKNILGNIENGLEKIAGLRTVYFEYKNDEEKMRRVGFIAQDVQAVYPEAVHVDDDESNTLNLQYSDMIPLLTKAIQELNAKVDAQAAEIAALKGTK